MAEETHTYTKATEWPGGFYAENLEAAIADSADITIGLARIKENADGTVDVVFKAPLPAADKTALDGNTTPAANGSLVQAHDPTPPSNDENLIVGLKNEDATRINFPQTEKKTPIFQPSIIPAGYFFYGTGAFDDIAGSKIGEGAQIAWEATVAVTPPQDEEIRGRFLHHVYVLGGHLKSTNPTIHDWVQLLVEAPASAPGDRTGTNDGNANKVATGLGFNVIVPAPGNDGDWQVDGNVFEAGEINQGLVPVPNPTGTGYWNWDPDLAPAATITPVANPAAPDGAYDLFDAAIPLARQANRYPLLTDGNVTPSAAIKGKKILPHWEWVFTLRRGILGTCGVAIRLETARKQTL